MNRIGVRALRQHASMVLRRVAAGERLEVTDRGHPVALLVPLPRSDALERLAAEGRLARGRGDLQALGRPLRVGRAKTPASSRLARARAAER
ncbi:MAG: type II toxin-antitoxin system Phd/YefM family antitoxin [Candidatus Binatia bacterium]